MNHLVQYVLTHGALLLFMLIVLEQAGLPLPSAPMLLSVGSFVSSGGINLAQALFASVAASVAADGLWYSVGRSRQSQPHLALAATNSWKGRLLGLVDRYGAQGLLPAKYVFSSNVLSLLAGQRGMPAARFLAFDGLASVLWSGGYIAAGYLLRNQMRWTAHALVPLALLLTAAAVWFVARAIIRGSNWLDRGSLKAFFGTALKPRACSFALGMALLVLVCPTLFAQQTNRDEVKQSVEAAVPNSTPQDQKQDQKDVEQDPTSATIVGTVTGIDDAPVSGATLTLEESDSSDMQQVETNDTGFYRIAGIPSGRPYHLVLNATGFKKWEASVNLGAGEFKILDIGKLEVEEVQTSIVVTPESSDEIAIEQVKAEETQRGFVIIPNFYAVYTPNPEPLSTKLKFSLAFRVFRDPFTFGGVTTLAGIDQAADSPKYVQGLKGYGERFGAGYANAFTDIMLDGAVLPALFHQDPRYFYQGTGSKQSRVFHVISSLVVAKGDNGHWQPNYSSVGGDLASSAISNLYYPKANRGAGLVFQGFAIDSAVHLAIRMLDEFAFRPPRVAPDSGSWNSNPHL